MRLVTLSGSPSHNQHLKLPRVTELPRLQLVYARVKDFFRRSGCEGAVATRSSCGAVVMTRIIKGFAVDWGDRWRRTVWAQLEHIYWFNVLPDQQVEFDRSSSPAALTEGDPGRVEATQAVKEFVEQEK
jgi:hypothetical protein